MSTIFEFSGNVVMTSRASYTYGFNSFNTLCENAAIIFDFPSPFRQSKEGKPKLKYLKIPNNQIYKVEDTLQLAVIQNAFATAIINKLPFKASGEMGLRDILITEAVYRVAVFRKAESVIY